MKILLAILLSIPVYGVAQKKQAYVQLDVDVLYNKYKDTKEVTLTTPAESITLKVEILYNTDNKPYAVILHGYFSNSSGDYIVDNLTRQKEKKGYRYVDGQSRLSAPFLPRGISSVDVNIYQKGSQYAKYGKQGHTYYPGQEFNLYDSTDYLYLEVGDIKRKSPGSTSNFEF